MSARRPHPVALRWSAAGVLRVGVAVGTAAGTAMALVVMAYGLGSASHTIWDAPMAIWAWVFGLEHFGAPGQHVWPVVLGLLAHMANSVLVGVVFTLAAAGAARRDLGTPLVLGLLYALALWAFMRYVVLPLNEGEARLFTTAAVAPAWVWWLAHAAFGVAAGLVFDAMRRTVPRRRDAPSPLEVSARRRRARVGLR